MAQAPSFQFYPGDWIAGTSTLTLEEKGAYIECLAHQWHADEGIAGDDPQALSRLLRVTPAVAKRVWVGLAKKFERQDDGTYRNARLEKIRAERLAFQSVASTRGKSGAKARWSKHASSNASSMQEASTKHASSNAQAMLDDGSSSSSSSTLASKNEARDARPRVSAGKRYADPHGMRVDPNAAALIIPREGQIISIPAGWWDRVRREYAATEPDVDAFAKWAGPIVAAEGLNDGGKRLAWLDALWSRWRASKAAPENDGLVRWEDFERERRARWQREQAEAEANG